MYMSIEMIQNQSSTSWTFDNVQLLLQDKGVEQLPLKRVSVSYLESGEYVLIDYSETEILPEVKTAIIRIAKTFHTTGLWQAANITAAL